MEFGCQPTHPVLPVDRGDPDQLAHSARVGGITAQRLLNTADEPQNWLIVHHDYNNSRHSPAQEINRDTDPLAVTNVMGSQATRESDGVISQAGELRCCAEATVRALERVVQPKMGLELLGVKAVRAFDAIVVIVSLSARQESRASRLVGAYLAETDPPRGAALAVLNATNRILGNFFATR